MEGSDRTMGPDTLNISNSILRQNAKKTRMWAIPNLMAALPKIGGALCSMPPQSG